MSERTTLLTSPTARCCSAAGLLLFGLLFRQLVTLLLAILITIVFAIPLAAAATRLERRGIPRPVGALVALLGGVAAVALVIAC